MGIVETLCKRANKMMKLRDKLPASKDEFLKYVGQFKEEDGFYHIGSNDELYGGNCCGPVYQIRY